MDIDKGTIFDGNADDDFSLHCFANVADYTDKAYGVCLEWVCYTDGRARKVIDYIKGVLKETDCVEMWCVWLTDYYEYEDRPFIYVLFGNILENALEAVAKIPQEESRVIALSVSRDMGVVRIRAKNRRPAGDIVLEDGLPTTTKENGEYHGFGTRSIKALAEKYGGAMNIAVNEEYYTLNIVLPGE